MEIEINVPFPPSVNHYWRHRRAGKGVSIYLSDEADRFRTDVRLIKFNSIKSITFLGRLSISIELCAPNRRKYDIDNRIKSLLDAMVHAGIMVDDEQIDEITIVRGKVTKGGNCNVKIKEINIDK